MAICKVVLCSVLMLVLLTPSLGQLYDLDWLWDSIKEDTDAPEKKQDDCGCNQYGSESWKGCDSLGQCECLDNVQGLKCDECIYGYWDLQSSSGCISCDCDPDGSEDYACDQANGQCNCKEGFGGLTCDTCAENFFGSTFDGCKACECNADGSDTQQCDAEGTCSCKTDIFGTKCDKCRENYYDVTRGCLECPACYSDIKSQVDSIRAMIQQLRTVVDGASGGTPITDPTFEPRLAQVEQDAADLLEQVQAGGTGTGGAVDELRDLLNDLRAKISGIQNNVDTGRRDANSAADKVVNVRGVIAEINVLIGQMKDYMDNEGKNLIDQAGGDSGTTADDISELVKKAEDLANEQEGDAQKIEDVSKNALSIAEDALKRIRNALGGTGTDVSALDDLKSKLDQAAADLEKVKKEADDALRKAQTSAANSEKILANAQARETDLDVDGLKTQANGIRRESDDLLAEINKLDTDGTAVMDEVKKNHDEAEQELKEAKQQIQRPDQLLARANAAQISADAAVTSAQAILSDAEKTLETLNDFANKVAQAETDAKEALKKEPNIRGIILEAETATTDANTALGSAKTNADGAKNTAEQAERIADSTKTSAAQEKDRADRLSKKATDLNKEAEKLRTDVDTFFNPGSLWDQKKKQAAQDEADITAAKAEAERIQKEADETFNLIVDTDKRLQAILDKLGDGSGGGTVDDGTLKTLQQTYDNLRDQWNTLNVADLLVRIRVVMETSVSGETVDLEELTLQVNNLEAIRNALPPGCFSAETGIEGT